MTAWLVLSHDDVHLRGAARGPVRGADRHAARRRAAIVGRRDFRSLVGASTRSLHRARVACLAPGSDRPAGHGRASGRWSPSDSPGWPRPADVRALRGLRAPPADRGHRRACWACPTPTATRSTGPRPGWRRSSPGATPTARIPRRAGRGHRRDAPAGAAAARHRPRAPRPARGRRHQHALGDRPPGRARLGRAGRHGQREVHLRGRVRDDGVPHLQRDPSTAGPAGRRPRRDPGRRRPPSPDSSRRVLRHTTVVHLRARRATTDVDLAGVRINGRRAGDRRECGRQPRSRPLGATRRAGPGPAAAVGPPGVQRRVRAIARAPTSPGWRRPRRSAGCGEPSRTSRGRPAPGSPGRWASSRGRGARSTSSMRPSRRPAAHDRIIDGPAWAGSVPAGR